jgi:hypothetical protein
MAKLVETGAIAAERQPDSILAFLFVRQLSVLLMLPFDIVHGYKYSNAWVAAAESGVFRQDARHFIRDR